MAKSVKKKEAVCRVATRLFVEKGFEKTSIRDIAEAGKMNSSGLYYYFEDKEAILYTILIEIMDESLARMQEIANRDVPLKEKIYSAGKSETAERSSTPTFTEPIRSEWP